MEQICQPILERCIPPLQDALESASLTHDQIDDVIMVGGATRTHKIELTVQEFFHGKQMNKQLHPDEAVAYGAAVLAGLLSGEQFGLDLGITLNDATSLSLGIDVRKSKTEPSVDKMSIIIPRNSGFPIEKTRRYTTSIDN